MIDLAPSYLETVRRILSEHVPNCEVRAFGSRATWEAGEHSDLDLAVVGDEPVDTSVMARLTEAFEESDLPIRVDVIDWNAITDGFHGAIEADCVVVQKRPTREAHAGHSQLRSVDIFPLAGSCHTIGEWSPFAYGKSLPERERSPQGTTRVYGSNGVVGYHDTPLTDGPTIIIGRKGTVGAVHYSPDPCWPIDTTFYVEGNDPSIQRFVYYALKAANLPTMNSDSAVPGLNRNAVHAKSIFVPPMEEQRAISHILGVLDDKIELNRRMSETLDEMARALFRSWFVDFDPVRAKAEGRRSGLPPHVDKLFPDSFELSGLGQIPGGWSVKELGEIVEFAYGKALKAENRRAGDIPVFGSNGQIGWHDESLVTGPGIIVGRKGNPGFVRWSSTDFYPIDTTFYVIPRGIPTYLPFLLFALEAQDLPSITTDTAVPGLNRNLAYMNRQVIPPRHILAVFDECVRPTITRARKLSGESRALATLRDAMLPKLVSGEFRLTGVEDDAKILP